MKFTYIVDQQHGPYYNIQEAVNASQRSWWRRLLHHFIWAYIKIGPGIYDDDLEFPLKGQRFWLEGDEDDIA